MAQDRTNWKVGEYSSYHSQWPNGDWEGFSLHVNKRVDEKTWELDVFHRTERRDTIIRFNVPIIKEKGALPGDLVGYKVLRGEEFKELDANIIIVKIMNMLSLRFVNPEKIKAKSVKKTFCCNVQSGSEYEDRWDEFDYSLFHTIHQSVPILGLIQTKKSNSDFSTQLTSFGRSTNDLSSYVTYPTFIDILSLKEISFPSFRIKYPSSWILSQSPPRDPKIEIWNSQLGGNIHAGYLMVKITTDNPENINKRLEEIKLTKVSPNHPLGTAMTFNLEEVDENGNFMYLFNFKIPGQLGHQLEGFYLNEDKTKLAEVILFTNFGAPVADKNYIPNLMKTFYEICKSFKFKTD